jgi:hypothetical protein
MVWTTPCLLGLAEDGLLARLQRRGRGLGGGARVALCALRVRRRRGANARARRARLGLRGVVASVWCNGDQQRR